MILLTTVVLGSNSFLISYEKSNDLDIDIELRCFNITIL